MTLAEKVELVRSSFNEVAFGWNDSGCFWHIEYGPRGAGNMIAGISGAYCAPEEDLGDDGACDFEATIDAFIRDVLNRPRRVTG